jgi:hypothetical protein
MCVLAQKRGIAWCCLEHGGRLGAWSSAGKSKQQRAGNQETGWPHNSGKAELGRQTRPSVVLSRSDEAEWLSYRAAITVAEKECCSVRKDCQERPYADANVRWCGSGERVNPPGDPIVRGHCLYPVNAFPPQGARSVNDGSHKTTLSFIDWHCASALAAKHLFQVANTSNKWRISSSISAGLPTMCPISARSSSR